MTSRVTSASYSKLVRLGKYPLTKPEILDTSNQGRVTLLGREKSLKCMHKAANVTDLANTHAKVLDVLAFMFNQATHSVQ